MRDGQLVLGRLEVVRMGRWSVSQSSAGWSDVCVWVTGGRTEGRWTVGQTDDRTDGRAADGWTNGWSVAGETHLRDVLSE